MPKLASSLAIAACVTAFLVTGLALSSSARIGDDRGVRSAAAIDPNAMMVRTPSDLPVLAHPIH